MNSQKSSSGASLREEMACLDCPQTKNQPEGDAQRLPELSTISDGSTDQYDIVYLEVGASYLLADNIAVVITF